MCLPVFFPACCAFYKKEIAFQSACHAVRIQVEGGKRAAEREGEHAVLARELPHYFALAMEENIEKEEER